MRRARSGESSAPCPTRLRSGSTFRPQRYPRFCSTASFAAPLRLALRCAA